MALHFISHFSSFKPQIIATKAQLSQNFSHLNHDSHRMIANKWNIDEEQRSSTLTPNGDLCINHSKKLEEIKNEFRNVGENSMRGLCMIDAMQRLNIDYHFQEEIEAFLRMQYMNYSNFTEEHAIQHTALRFRLLRQQGHFVPPETVFDKFRNKEGKFKTELSENMRGMIELYEASQLGIAGEDILDEAEEFSKQILKEMMSNLNNHEAKFVKRTLEHPFHKSLPMFTTRNFFGDFHGMDSLKEVAKMDFSLLQRLHHQEILQISKWWRGLGLAKELKYARNQPLKWYIWSLACLTDPNLSEERIELTKPIALIYIIDDIFDVYGTLDELTLFTKAVSRWDITATEELPDYMKTCLRILFDVTNEISFKVYEKHGWNPIDSLRKTWKSLCEAFLVEAEWFGSGKMTNSEEYLKNGIVSCGVHVVLVHVFFLLCKGLTSENVEIIDKIPAIISSSAMILRLWDDLGNSEDENQEGKDGSYVRCLMMERQDYSMRRAREEVMVKISDTWKTLNKECLFQSHFHKLFIKSSLNLARMVPLMYNYDHNHSLPGLEEQVNSLLYDHFPF